jgi:hypothetical protein
VGTAVWFGHQAYLVAVYVPRCVSGVCVRVYVGTRGDGTAGMAFGWSIELQLG